MSKTKKESNEEEFKLTFDGKKGVQQLVEMERKKPDDLLIFFKNKTSANTKYNKKSADTEENDVRFYYAVYGRDAVFLANYHLQTLAALKFLTNTTDYQLAVGNLTAQSNITRRDVEECKGKGLPVVYINDKDFGKVLQKCINQKKMKVEVWAKEGGDWACERTGSPGNLAAFQEYFHDDSSVSATSLAVKLTVGQHIELGVAFCESASNVIYYCKFYDNEQLSILESLLTQTGASECLFDFEKNNVYHKKLKDILDRSSVILTEQPKKNYRDTGLEQDLKTLVRGEKQYLSALEDKVVTPPLACLIRYLDLIADPTNHGVFTLKKFGLERYMKIDSAAVSALNILPQPGDLNPQMSLYGLLNTCQTNMGKKRLMEWVRMPLLNREEIDYRLDFVDAFYNDQVTLNQVRKLLKSIPDLNSVMKRINKGRGGIVDMVKLYQFIQRIPDLIEALDGYEGREEYKKLLEESFIDSLRQSAEDFTSLCNLVETAVDTEALNRHEYLINSDWNDELKELKFKKDELMEAIECLREEASNDTGIEVKLEKTKTSQYFFKVTGKDSAEKVTKGKNKKKYTVLEQKPSYCKFISEDMKERAAEYAEIYDQYTAKQSELIKECMCVVVTFTSPLEKVIDEIAHLDVLSNFAAVAHNNNYVRPKVLDSGQPDDKIVLDESKHPCLAMQDFGDQSFIANDVDLIKGKSSFTVITGPNMGGKSTYIRQIGMIVIMAQMGCFVPCTSATISVRDCILARVGASDSQLRGISTFMAEMLETSTILQTATENSLIIIDELGRGTSSYDGFGLAWAISEHIIREKKSFCLFATHFHELTTLTHLCDPSDPASVKKYGAFLSVANKSVTVRPENHSIVMCYKIQDGPSNKSFGIEVAKLANFPESVVNVAKRKADELESIDNEDEDDAPATKRRKLSSNAIESFEFMQQTLKDFCQIPIDNLSDEELQERISQMKQSIDNNKNVILRSTITRYQGTQASQASQMSQ